MGWCDSNGPAFCGRITSGVTSYYRYAADGSGSFCQFDPYVKITASSPVTLCEYFNCGSVQCPSGTTATTLSGLPGCCTTGAVREMAIKPACHDAGVVITVEAGGTTCTSYELKFHT